MVIKINACAQISPSHATPQVKTVRHDQWEDLNLARIKHLLSKRVLYEGKLKGKCAFDSTETLWFDAEMKQRFVGLLSTRSCLVFLMRLASCMQKMGKQRSHQILHLTKYFVDLKMSLYNAGKSTRMSHKHSIRRDDCTCLFTREKLMGKTLDLIPFSQEIRKLEEENLRYFI